MNTPIEEEDDGSEASSASHDPCRREVLGCDFVGLRNPEMCKRRPVVIVSAAPARPRLAIVVPLSTSAPDPVRPWHYKLSAASQWDRRERWAKCDMIYAVSFDRFFLWKLGRDRATGKRLYLIEHRISEADFGHIQAAILKALNINAL